MGSQRQLTGSRESPAGRLEEHVIIRLEDHTIRRRAMIRVISTAVIDGGVGRFRHTCSDCGGRSERRYAGSSRVSSSYCQKERPGLITADDGKRENVGKRKEE